MTIASTSRMFWRRGDAGAERLDGVVDEAGRQSDRPRRERAVPDAARQPRAPALLHDLEQVGLLAVLVRLARPALHRRAAGVRLHAAEPPAAAALAADAHDDVADLAARAPPGPRAAVEDDPAADPGPPEHAEQRPVGPPGAEGELRVGGDLDVVAEVQARAERLLEGRAERELALPVGQVAALVTVPAFASTSPGEPTPTPASASVSTPASLAASVIAAAIAAATSAGPPVVGVGWRAWPSTTWAGRRRPPGSSCRRDRCRRVWRRSGCS